MKNYIIQKSFFLISFILLGCGDDISVVDSLDTKEINKIIEDLIKGKYCLENELQRSINIIKSNYLAIMSIL